MGEAWGVNIDAAGYGQAQEFAVDLYPRSLPIEVVVHFTRKLPDIQWNDVFVGFVQRLIRQIAQGRFRLSIVGLNSPANLLITLQNGTRIRQCRRVVPSCPSTARHTEARSAGPSPFCITLPKVLRYAGRTRIRLLYRERRAPVAVSAVAPHSPVCQSSGLMRQWHVFRCDCSRCGRVAKFIHSRDYSHGDNGRSDGP